MKVRKKLILGALFLVMAFGVFFSSTTFENAIASSEMLNGGLSYETQVVDGEIFYLVETPEQLSNIRNNLDKNFMLANSLDLSEIVQWEPIGKNSNEAFTGIFDGEGYEISKLIIDNKDLNYAGLFGYIRSANIRNLSLSEIEIDGNYRVGGLAGQARDSIILNCQISLSSLKGNQYIGGLIGQTYKCRLIQSKSFDNSLEGYARVGGFVGSAYGSMLFESQSLTNTINVDGGVAGGLLGESVKNDIFNSYSMSEVSGDNSIGGLIGNSRESDIFNSYSMSEVSGDNSIGGLIGNSSESNISNSYSTGIVNGESYIGGLIGNSWESNISNSYSTGIVNGEYYIGGFIGGGFDNEVSNSYYDIQISSHNWNNWGEFKFTEEMYSIFEEDTENWITYIDDYPKLRVFNKVDITIEDILVAYNSQSQSVNVVIENDAPYKIYYEGIEGTEYEKSQTPPSEIGTYNVEVVADYPYYGKDTAKLTIVNNPPVVSSLEREGEINQVFNIHEGHFLGNYTDADAYPLSKIKITGLPSNGTLKLGNEDITLNQEIGNNQLNGISLVPEQNYSGKISFNWRASDGFDYSENEAVFTINVKNPNSHYFYIKNLRTQNYLTSLDSNDRSYLTMTDDNTSSYAMWEIEDLNDGFYRFLNKESNRRFRPESDDDRVNNPDGDYLIYQGPPHFMGAFTRWEMIDSGDDGYFHLKNMATLKHMRTNNSFEVEQVPDTFTGAWTRWKLVPVPLELADQVAPIVEFWPDGEEYENKIVVKVIVKDDESGLNSWRYQLSDDGGASYGNWSSLNPSSKVILDKVGSWKLRVEAKDNAGNVTIAESEIFVIEEAPAPNEDKTPPQITFSKKGGLYHNDSIEVLLLATDEGGSGVQYSKYQLSNDNGATYQDWVEFDTSATITLDEEGQWKIKVEAKDNAGNITTVEEGIYTIVKLVDGRYYRIQNMRTQNYLTALDSNDRSYLEMKDNGASEYAMWKLEDLGGGYYRFLNKVSDRRFRPESEDDIINNPNGNYLIYQGTPTQRAAFTQWEMVLSKDGFHFKNVRTQKHIRTNASLRVEQVPDTFTGARATWRLVPVE